MGHLAGDELLAEVAATLRNNLRATDLPARLGGDEFAILLPETGHDEAGTVIARLREKLLARMKERGWPVTFSIGVAVFSDPPEQVDELVRAADGLMYEVKRNGKDAILAQAV